MTDSAPSVLVVEDDPDIRELVALALTRAGFSVAVASDGREALSQVASHRPDLVVLDMMLPIMDGRAFCKALGAMGASPRVIVMTAGERAPQSAAELGAVAWLAKPFEIDELVATVRGHLS